MNLEFFWKMGQTQETHEGNKKDFSICTFALIHPFPVWAEETTKTDCQITKKAIE